MFSKYFCFHWIIIDWCDFIVFSIFECTLKLSLDMLHGQRNLYNANMSSAINSFMMWHLIISIKCFIIMYFQWFTWKWMKEENLLDMHITLARIWPGCVVYTYFLDNHQSPGPCLMLSVPVLLPILIFILAFHFVNCTIQRERLTCLGFWGKGPWTRRCLKIITRQGLNLWLR